MNTLKRIFVMMYLTGAMVLVVKSVLGLASGANTLSWLGVLMTVFPIVWILSMAMMLKRTARTSANFPFSIMLAALGVGIAGWCAFYLNGSFSLFYLAGGSFTAFLIYVFWYSRFGRTPSPEIKVGTSLPDFELVSADGETVSSETLTQTPVILIFIRGNWCPLCMGQVNEMSARIGEFSEKGIRVAFIAPQSVGKTKALAKGRPDGLEFYSDTKNAAGRRLKIDNPASLPFGMEILGYRSETVLPTVIATAPGGDILWTHETDNYRVRPTIKALLSVFE